MHPGLILIGLWLAWAVSWIVAARWSSTARRVAGGRQVLLYRLLMLAGGAVLAIPARTSWALHLWWPTPAEAWLCVFAALAGFAFCWWARLHLGTLWSGSVTIKADHHIIDTGPYALVRHPIYSGLLLALLATALIKGTVLGFAGVAIILAGIVMKAKLEENVLRADLGTQTYDAYARRVPMLVPFWRN
ncbi:protein-S-isoprenylcysteine methyltransferase [Labrys miyagiensis]